MTTLNQNKSSQDVVEKNSADSTNYIVREMTVEDLNRVCQMEQMYFKTPWSINSFLAELNAPYSNCYILENNTHIIGYAVAWFLEGEFHLANIAIDDKFRKQGIGFRFVKWLLNMARQNNCKHAFLEVRESNTPAIKPPSTHAVNTAAQYGKSVIPENSEFIIVMILTQILAVRIAERISGNTPTINAYASPIANPVSKPCLAFLQNRAAVIVPTNIHGKTIAIAIPISSGL